MLKHIIRLVQMLLVDVSRLLFLLLFIPETRNTLNTVLYIKNQVLYKTLSRSKPVAFKIGLGSSRLTCCV